MVSGLFRLVASLTLAFLNLVRLYNYMVSGLFRLVASLTLAFLNSVRL